MLVAESAWTSVSVLSVGRGQSKHHPERAQTAPGTGGAPTPQMLAVPPAPQTSPPAQVPQEATLRAMPQLSVPVTAPQPFPRRAQKATSVSTGQAQTPEVPAPPQVLGDAQVPQDATERDLPQLSFAVSGPQFLASRLQNAASLSAVQPHTPEVLPPPQV